MIRSKSLSIGAIIFLLVSGTFLAYQRLHKPRVLILHSYRAQMPWVRGLNRGVEKVFGDKAYIDLQYFYMDTKHNRSSRYLKHLQYAVASGIQRWKPDVVIAFDFDAQNVMASLLAKGLNNAIIFAGITNEEQLDMFSKTPNITGIAEKIPVQAIREILSLMFRNKRRIYYLSDDSSAARSLEVDVRSQNWGSFNLVAYRRVKTLAEWRQAVKEAQSKADILLVSLYHTLQDGNRVVNRQNLVAWMNQYSNIPVVGLYESFIIDGGMLAIAISSLEQGFSAAHMAWQLVEKKKKITTLPMQEGKTFSLVIDKEALQRHFPEAQIPVILDAFSRSHWKPDKSVV